MPQRMMWIFVITAGLIFLPTVSLAQKVYVTGNVVMEDGATPPPANTLIELVCFGNATPQGRTTAKGDFSIMLGTSSQIADASSRTARGGTAGPSTDPARQGQEPLSLATCDLRAHLDGYVSTTLSLAARRYGDSPELGTIVLRLPVKVEGVTVSATSAMASKDAKKAFDKGLELSAQGKDEDAQKSFEKAVELHPKYAAAWLELGRLAEKKKNLDQARKDYGEAISTDATFIPPRLQLYAMAVRESNWKAVAEGTDAVLKLDSVNYLDAYYYNAVANFQLGNFQDAEKSARQALKLDINRRNPKTNYVLGGALANEGKYAEALNYMRAYLASSPAEAESVKKQIANIESAATQAAPKAQP